jgi:hypothetical protein
LDTIPTEFATAMEVCPCHRQLLDGLDAYQ